MKSSSSSAGYLRFPHINGDVVTFTADDDVWLAPVAGGRAWRLSSDHAPVNNPRLSPDGAHLAWTSCRDGAPEVRLTEVEGGRARRLTYWNDSCTKVVGWAGEGEVIAVTGADLPFDRPTWAHIVPMAGGAPRRQPFGPVADLAMAGGATALLTGSSGRDPAYWKRYRGGTAGRLWARATGEQRFTPVLTGMAGQFACVMLVDDRLAFLSDHEGTSNLYSCALDGTDLRRHTDHEGFYARQASTDGHRVVYQRAGEIWLLDSLGAAGRRVEIILGPAAPVPVPRLVSAQDRLDRVSPDETGRASVIEVQGTIHWLTHKDGPARALSVSPDARARLPAVLGTSGQAVWVTDADGSDALEVAPVNGPGAGQTASRRLAGGQLGFVTSLATAPDGSRVAVASRDGRLQVADIGSGRLSLLATSDDGPVTGLVFSPDSAWLAWSQPGPRPLRRIRLARLADEFLIDVTDGRFNDDEPIFTGDGRYLAFLSRRSFDPVYDAHSFDLSFPSGYRPYLVTLAAAASSPFGPLVDGRPVAQEEDAAQGPGPQTAGDGAPAARVDAGSGVGEAGAGGDAGPGAVGGASGTGESRAADTSPRRPRSPVIVDTEGLADRVVSVPVEEALYSSLRWVTGGLAWLKSPLTGVLGEGSGDPDDDRLRPRLERFDLRQRTCSELAGELDWFEVSGDGSRLLICDRGELRVVGAERKEGDDGSEPLQVDLSRARFLADPAAQRRHAFDEAGRVQRHDFWVADMAEVDWDAVLDAYRPLLAGIRTADDFADLLWEVLGELGTSHAYVQAASSSRQPASPPVGKLGADLAQAPDGTWLVTRVLPAESSDPRARSPLAAPGAAIEAGSRLLAVDGQPVDPGVGPGPLLVGAVRKPVELTVAADSGQARRVAVVPLASDRRLRYQDWVAANRRLVRAASDGQAGYLHVPDMMGEGWAHFHRDLRTELRRDLLILDVRNNRGGHTSQLVVEKLARRVIGWDIARRLRPETYPLDAPRGPVVAITDEFAGSDGDVITAAIRVLRLGTVVGTRTWGGVIGIDEGFRLLDGTAITVPRYALWFEGYGWGVENHGIDPDIEVVITPDDWAAGRDPQLETALRLGLEALHVSPAVQPPQTSDRPSRRRPPLPPR